MKHLAVLHVHGIIRYIGDDFFNLWVNGEVGYIVQPRHNAILKTLRIDEEVRVMGKPTSSWDEDYFLCVEDAILK